MLNTLLGTKDKMEAAFVGTTRVPLTWVKMTPCVVTQVKSQDQDGYWAIQLGFGERKSKNISKQLQGHLKGAIKDKKAPLFLREIRLSEAPDMKVGDIVKITDVFKKGDVIKVTGTSKGKGFAGVVKRWGFAGGPRTHGQSDRERAPGSIGQGTTPGRVYKGKKMAGRMGGQKVSVSNLTVVDINSQNNMMAVSGAVPGRSGGLLIIKKLASGSLEELEEEAPEVVVQEVEEEASAGEEDKQNAKEN